jgi:hypothetical protein
MRIDVSKQVRLVKLSHMRYQHRDMEKISVFMQGMYLECPSKCLQPLKVLCRFRNEDRKENG